MKILFLEQFSELGGGQRCLLDLLPAIRERGWSALVAAPGSGPLFDAAREAGAETAGIELGPYANGTKTVADAARFAIDSIHLGRWIARQDAAVVYSSAPRPLPAAAMGACGRPVIFHAQHFLGRGYAVALAGWAIQRARAAVIADAKYIAGQFVSYSTPQRLHLVYNGVPEIPFTPRRFTHGRPWRIGLIGRIAPMKGQDAFLRAAAMLPSSLKATFVICGAPMFCPPAYVQEVHHLARNLPVDFLGWREDVDNVLASLDLLVVPSTSTEATTRVILEAFSAGVPVVAYAVGGIPEIVRDGENGFLVQECEPGALARKIVQATSADLSSVAARARADWQRNYTVARYREKMLGVIAASTS
jgi:glycosyltransferase involved in cell wall biosynthesis